MVIAKKLKQKIIISEASNFENDLIKPEETLQILNQGHSKFQIEA